MRTIAGNDGNAGKLKEKVRNCNRHPIGPKTVNERSCAKPISMTVVKILSWRGFRLRHVGFEYEELASCSRLALFLVLRKDMDTGSFEATSETSQSFAVLQAEDECRVVPGRSGQVRIG